MLPTDVLNRKVSKGSRLSFFAYFILFNAAWLIWVLFGYPRLRLVGEKTFWYALMNIAVRGLLWVLPVFLYLRYVDNVKPAAYLKLTRYWRRGLFVGVGFSLLNFLVFVAQHRLPHDMQRHLSWNTILSTAFLIGFFEELPYRGFIFQKLSEWCSWVTAAIISSLLFLMIHLPGWLSLRLLTFRNVTFVLVFGALMAILFRYAKSLWAPIVAHSLNDFFASVLFHV